MSYNYSSTQPALTRCLFKILQLGDDIWPDKTNETFLLLCNILLSSNVDTE